MEQASPIIIAGMHRSGTSLVTALLQSAGLDIGRDLMKPSIGNSRGHYENHEFVNFHKRILLSQGFNDAGFIPDKEIDLDDVVREEALELVRDNRSDSTWGWKDPRNSLFLGFWSTLLPQAKFLFVHRSPWETVNSLYRRAVLGNKPDAVFFSSPELAIKVWLSYNQKILAFAKANPNRCLLLGIEQVVRDIHGFVNDVNQKFDVNLTCSNPNLYEPSLLNREEINASGLGLLELFYPDAITLYQELLTLSSGSANHDNQSTTSRDSLVLNSRRKAFGSWLRVHQLGIDLESERENRERENAEGQKQIARLKLSHDEELRQVTSEATALASSLEAKIESLESDKAILKSSFEDKVKGLSQDNESLSQDNESLSRDNESLSRDNESLSRDNDALKKELQELSSKSAQDKLRFKSWLYRLDDLILSMINSNRWRLGNLVYTTYRKLLFKPIDPGPEIHRNDLVNEISQWSGMRQELQAVQKKNLAPEQKNPTPERNVSNNVFWTLAPPNETPQKDVSIIILNKDGVEHLRNLFESFIRFNTYKQFKFIVVDHNSQDSSVTLLKQFSEKLPIEIVECDQNYSFSYSNNRAARLATTDYLLFLNNDIIFNSDILSNLLSYLQIPEAGAIGIKLVYPENHTNFPNRNQHVGIKFNPDYQYQFPRPFNLGPEFNTNEVPKLGIAHPAITAAAMACRSDDFWAVGGFCEDYFYGYEDVDLCIKFLSQLNKFSIAACDIELIHDESSTQRKDEKASVRERRLRNIHHLQRRFGISLKRQIELDFISNNQFWSNRRARIAFAVTEIGPEAKAGDYFTALELGSACHEHMGWDIAYLPKDSWYDLHGVDVLVTMVDSYDLKQIYNHEPGLIKVAWLRNWFDRWAARPCFYDYDVYLASSEKATNYLTDSTGVEAHVFPIATNANRFNPKLSPRADLDSDYCFTGSYWKAPRQIVDCLKPKLIPHTFALYGGGWSEVSEFSDFWRGFVRYEELPQIYASTKVVLDDANHVTLPWASVNSRVFDALASGKLVLSNGEEGVKSLFGDEFPVYNSESELTEKLNYYLSHDLEREQLTARLREIVVNKHTYERRAVELSHVLAEFLETKFRICIKVPAPNWDVVHEWGDYHFALALQRAFSAYGHSTRIEILPDWYSQSSYSDDVVLVLRGLSEYEPQPNHINIMWNISHPDKVTHEEYNKYDWVFVASSPYANHLSGELQVPVSALLQCTDPRYFYKDVENEAPNHEILFVGNSRKKFRKIVRDTIDIGKTPSVYGSLWENFIPKEYIAGQHIDNSILRQYYSKCKILLNDHWDSMRDLGFISNRLFDAGACGCFIVSDPVQGREDVFGNSLVTYDDPADLKELIEYYSDNDSARQCKAEELQEIVLKQHTFRERAKEIIATIQLVAPRKVKSFPPISKVNCFSKLDLNYRNP